MDLIVLAFHSCSNEIKGILVGWMGTAVLGIKKCMQNLAGKLLERICLED
jgi:hypothetical protein